MNKIVKDGKVAVIYSPGFGAGWSTWAHGNADPKVLCMDARIAQHVLDGNNTAAIATTLEIYPDMYTGGGHDLSIEWVPVGCLFLIEEYDGSETVRTLEDFEFMTA